MGIGARFAGESAAQIASETGQSLAQVDNELGIPTAPANVLNATSAGALELNATATAINTATLVVNNSARWRVQVFGVATV